MRAQRLFFLCILTIYSSWMYCSSHDARTRNIRIHFSQDTKTNPGKASDQRRVVHTNGIWNALSDKKMMKDTDVQQPNKLVQRRTLSDHLWEASHAQESMQSAIEIEKVFTSQLQQIDTLTQQIEAYHDSLKHNDPSAYVAELLKQNACKTVSLKWCTDKIKTLEKENQELYSICNQVKNLDLVALKNKNDNLEQVCQQLTAENSRLQGSLLDQQSVAPTARLLSYYWLEKNYIAQQDDLL